jgi:hypothetical protein
MISGRWLHIMMMKGSLQVRRGPESRERLTYWGTVVEDSNPLVSCCVVSAKGRSETRMLPVSSTL